MKFRRKHLGFYRLRTLADLLGVTPRAVRNWLGDGEAPDKYETAILMAGGYDLFPIDEPPPPDVIGPTATKAFDALRRGHTELAAMISHHPISGTGMDWRTGKPYALEPLELIHLELVNGIAWARNANDGAQQVGFKDLVELRRKTWRLFRQATPDDLRYYRYVYIMAASYSLTWLWTRNEAKIRKSQRYANRIVRFANKLMELAPRDVYVNVLCAWNVTQYASIGKGDDIAFLNGLGKLEDFYGERVSYIVEHLEDDPDTAAMLKRPRIAAHVRRMGTQAVSTKDES